MKPTYYLSFLVILLMLAGCKKKTTITVKVFNPALNEYVPDAEVVLLEIKEPGSLGAIAGTPTSCQEIAAARTDANGFASFDQEKLKSNSRYHYKVGIKESWGVMHSNPCESQVQDYLVIGGSQEVKLYDYVDVEYKVEYNNSYLQPSVSGDSLICYIEPVEYYNSKGTLQGGGGGTIVILTHDAHYPIANTYYGPTTKLFACRFAVKTRKRKLGAVSTSIDTVRAYPGKGPVIIRLNW